MRQASEPTVEEILESIKQVIARDSRENVAEDGLIEDADGLAASIGQEEGILDLAENAECIDEACENEPGDSPLLNEDAQASMRESLAALSVLAQPGAPPQIVRSGETSLEGMVRELLRPALAEWLDKNLPPLVERMVAAEIKRIAGKRG